MVVRRRSTSKVTTILSESHPLSTSSSIIHHPSSTPSPPLTSTPSSSKKISKRNVLSSPHPSSTHPSSTHPSSTHPSSLVHPILPHLTLDEITTLSKNTRQILICIHGLIYDITSFAPRHPGGTIILQTMIGVDATDSFLAYHPPGVIRNYLLKQYLYGVVVGAGATPSPRELALRKLDEKFWREGIYEPKPSFIIKKMIILFLLIMITLLIIYHIRSSNSVLLTILGGVIWGLYYQQAAFIGHDIGHNSIFSSPRLNTLFGYLVGNFMTGLSVPWWKANHNTHHVNCNSVESDPDIQHLPFFAVTPAYIKEYIWSNYYQRIIPLSAVAHYLVRYQHCLYHIVIMIARINLYAQSMMRALRIGFYWGIELPTTSRQYLDFGLDILTQCLHWIGMYYLLTSFPTRSLAILFFIVSHAVSGILHVQITLSHFAMETYRGQPYKKRETGAVNSDGKARQDDWIAIQMNGSMNIQCEPWFDWFHGGLQFQIEHHLFPRIPRSNLRYVRDKIQQFAKDWDAPYVEVSFWRANLMVLECLKKTAYEAKEMSPFVWESVNAIG